MGKLTLLLDCDGTLLDWETSFNHFMQTHGFELNADKVNSYCLGQRFSAAPRQVDHMVNKFNRSPQFGKLPVYRDALHHLKAFHQSGFKLVVITCPGDDSETVKLRRENLKQAFGDIFHACFCLPLGSSKQELLAEFRNSTAFFVDDHQRYALEAASLNVPTFLIEQAHNVDSTSHPLITKVSNSTPWSEINSLYSK